jgi:hypothetical protein
VQAKFIRLYSSGFAQAFIVQDIVCCTNIDLQAFVVDFIGKT